MNKEIEQQIHDFAEKMYQAGYADGNNTNLIDEAYQEGLNDAWECFKKLVYPTKDGGLSTDDLREIFGTLSLGQVVRAYSPSEAIKKINDWGEKQKQKDDGIRVGDEVFILGNKNFRGVVTNFSVDEYDGLLFNVLIETGKKYLYKLNDITKTGKHYDAIEEVLKELRGDEE